MGESDEEYRPPVSRRKRRVAKKTQQTKLKPAVSNNKDLKSMEMNLPEKEDEKQAAELNYKPKSDVETSSSVCMHMPTLEEDLAMTSSDDSSASTAGDKNTGGSKEHLDSSPPKRNTLTLRIGEASKDKGLMQQSRNSGSSKGRIRRLISKSDDSDSGSPPPEGNKDSDLTASSTRRQTSPRRALFTNGIDDMKTKKRVASKRKRRLLISSSSSEEEETASTSNSATTETEPELLMSTSSVPSETAPDNADKLDNLQIVISPLTEEKIRQINTPQKKPRMVNKGCQTVVNGLTWSIDWDRIDVNSEHFDKLRTLLNRSSDRTATRKINNGTRTSTSVPVGSDRSFQDVDIPSRSSLHDIMNSQSPPHQQQPAKPAKNGTNRTLADKLLFQREVSEVEQNSTSNSADPLARQKLEQVVNTVRSTFRIPKLSKKPSTSPQVVTSSTPHVVDTNDDRDDELGTSPLPSTSRATDESVDNRHAVGGAGTVPRPVINEYVDDQNQQSNEDYEEPLKNDAAYDRQKLRAHIMLQEKFVPPVNRKEESDPNPSAVPKSDNDLQADEQLFRPGPSVSADKKITLPNRADLFNVKRTIRNEIAQPQQIPPQLHGLQQPVSQPYVSEATKYNPPQQPTLSGFPMLGGGFQPSYAGANTNSFSRGLLPAYAGGMNMASMFGGGMMGMQQPVNNFTNLIAMLWEQCRQQQMNPNGMLSSVSAMGPSQMPSNQLPNMGQGFPQMMMPSTNPVPLPQHENETQDGPNFIFGCIDFLNNKCNKAHCRYPHVLPREEEVFQKLSTQSRDSIMIAYRFVAIRDDLFVKYFPVFATVMGRNNMRHQLVSTVADCEQPKRPIQYYKYIVEGLKMSGTSPVQAVQAVLEKHTKRSFLQINVLVDLILDTGDSIPFFLNTLDEFSNVKDYLYEIVSINRLLEFCNKPDMLSRGMAMFVSKLIINVPLGQEQLVNGIELIKFTREVGLDPELAMNVEYILRKYGNVEIPS